MKLFDLFKKAHNPMDDLAEDLCFGVSLYRKAALQNVNEEQASILLDLADYRENILAQLYPYISVCERSPLAKEKSLKEQNTQAAEVITKLKSDHDWFIVRQIEAKTIDIFEHIQNMSTNTLVTYFLQHLAMQLESKLDELLALAQTQSECESVA